MKKQIVTSGTSVISEKKQESLEAYLGSCVGVTLVDRQADVGGLLHLLLAEPTGSDAHFIPENYATTGLPHFLNKLMDAGASKENLEACVAGGALIGPVSDMDLSLDIGGRTAERVQVYLEDQGIPIIETETGGYSGRKMSLDLYQWNTTIEPTWQIERPSMSPFQTDVVFNIDEAIQRVKPIPQVALKVIRMIHRDDYTMKEVGNEIRRDQVISGRVLNLCNSAIMGLKTVVDSIDRALVLVGEKRLLKLVVTASVKSLFPQSFQGYSLCKGGIFHHAIGTALIAQELAAFTEKVAPDIAYTAGLLHDIGKIPLDQVMTANAPFFYRSTQEKGHDLCEMERLKFGVDHTEAGMRLGKLWTLPNNLINVIANHHQPEASTEDEELVTMVYIADLLMSKFQAHHELEQIDTEKLSDRLNRLGLSSDHFPMLIDRIPRNIFQSASMPV
ncbi:MAG: HDOD domain-containing protein [Deltaproteobacteria bacterium]|jgi:putative nucleotidyltransferase with HDIG domain|nr:HDOD domain-containing protein [Deltaproteobacteria bacterium]